MYYMVTSKVRSTIMVTKDVFHEMRYYAMRRGQDISSFTEEALREKISQCKEQDKLYEEVRGLKATVEVARKLYQQIKQKPDFNSIKSDEFIKTITSGIDPRYHDIVTEGIREVDRKKLGQSLEKLYEIVKKHRLDVPITYESSLVKGYERSEQQVNEGRIREHEVS